MEPNISSDSNADTETKSAVSDVPEPITFDIEHMPVADDPRKWSTLRKVCISHELLPS